MFGLLRSTVSRSPVRSFSTSCIRPADLSKLTLIGHLLKDPEVKKTKTERDYIVYTVVTQNYPPPPLDANGERKQAASTFHRVLSFQDASNKYIQSLRKGTRVYVEANYELREPESGADPTAPQGQRQIFLRHETIRVLNRPAKPTDQELESESSY